MSINEKKISRRALLKASTAIATSPLFFVCNGWAGTFNPDKNAQITFGFKIPQTGSYSEEGADELRGYKLAVEHLNGEGDGGMLHTLKPLHLNGNGILGKRVDYVIGDTHTDPKDAVAYARHMMTIDQVSMVSGGSSSAVAIAVQKLAQQLGVIFMAGVTHSNDTTGKDRRRYGFRHFFNAQMSGMALGPILERELGGERSAFHLTADYTWGWTQEASIRETTEGLGWRTLKTVRTPIGTSDYSPYIDAIRNSGADTLILNHYGQDMIHSLTQVTEAGLRDRQVNGNDFKVVAPLYSRLMAQGAGDALKGVLGTSNWHWSLQDAGSKAFTTSFANRYGFPPSQAAHTCYVQTLLYATAVERAGTLHPPEVIRQLEGLNFEGAGNGPVEYRAEDHQCMKSVLVVRGNPNPSSRFDLLEVEQEVPRQQVTYSANRFPGELGPYQVEEA